MYVLGISAYYHDSSATLIKNGDIVAAAQEERFTRKKHDANLPYNAIEYCLYEANIDFDKLDAVVFYENPIKKLDRWLITLFNTPQKELPYITEKFQNDISGKMFLDKELRMLYGKIGKNDNLYTVSHHISHSASAYYPSPFNDSAIITFDGVGEWTTTSYGVGENSSIKLSKSINFPHSLGLLYSAFTYFCGFKVNSGEYKLMGLAPFGIPKYTKIIKDHIITINNDGSFELNLEYFDFLFKKEIIGYKFEKLFGTQIRDPKNEEIKQIYKDLAASVQQVLEEIIIKIASHVKNETQKENLCLAGGVALNCSANGKLILKKIFKNIWIQPASGDAGGSLGAALYYFYQTSNAKKRFSKSLKKDFQKNSLLGPSFSKKDIESYLQNINAPYKNIEFDLEKLIAYYITQGKIVALFQGRMEFGPRALGNRSILGNATDPTMQKKMNLKIKFRESFRPFAPAVIEEEANKYFNTPISNRYMLIVSKLQKKLCQKGKNTISPIPAVTHVDCSARVQTVTKETNKRFYNILKELKKIINYPICINTSFNIRGEPIVCTPEDAYKCFMATDIDILVLENFILEKDKQPNKEHYKYLKDAYELD